MSSRHLHDGDIERYQQRTMAADELFAVHDHVLNCDICHRRLIGEDLVDNAYRFIREELHAAALEHSDHLRFEQIVAYASGQIDDVDREILETHLEECQDCDAEVADIRLYRATLRLIPPRGPAPVGAGKRWWLPSGWPMLYQIPIQVAAMILIGVLASRFATVSLRSKTDQLANQISELRVTNDNLTTQLAQQAQTGARVSPGITQPEQEIRGGSSSLPTVPNNPTEAAAVTLNDGGRTLRLDTSGALETGGLVPAKYVQLVASALTSGRLSTPSAVLRPLGSQTRSASQNDAFQLLAPVGVVVTSGRPAFRWTPLNEARSYSVVIRDASSDDQVESNPVSAAEWVPEKPLERGHTYSWVVVATLSDGKRLYVPGAGSPEAMFKILDKSASDELERAKTRPNQSHVLMAVLYARWGLVAEAQNELNALEAENPKSAVIARLQRSLKTNLRR